jgi:hypothetical protein
MKAVQDVASPSHLEIDFCPSAKFHSSLIQIENPNIAINHEHGKRQSIQQVAIRKVRC